MSARQDFITFLAIENHAFNMYIWRTVKSNPIESRFLRCKSDLNHPILSLLI